MRPLTSLLPKPLLPCMGVPLIDIIIHQLRQHHAQHIYINTHHLPAKFAYLAQHPHVTLQHEPTLLGSAGFVHNLDQRNHDLLVYNGDILSDLDFTAIYHTHQTSGAIATLALLPDVRPDTRPVFAQDGYLVALQPTGDIHHQAHTFACAQVLSADFLQLITTHNFTHIHSAWQYALDHHYPLAVFLHHGLWFDIGTPAHFFLAHQVLHQKLQHNPDFLHITTLLDDELHLHHDHVIVGTPQIEKNCLIKAQTFITSSQVTIHAPVQLDHCVVMHNTTVRRNHTHQLLLGEHILACG